MSAVPGSRPPDAVARGSAASFPITAPRERAPERTASEPRWKTLFVFALTLAAVQLVAGPKMMLSQWGARTDDNAAVVEGLAWLDGRIDLPHPGRDAAHDRMHDTAFFNGNVYNVFPPLFSALSAALAPLHRFLSGRADVWLPWTYVGLLFAPLPVLGFVVFRRRCGDSTWAGLLTLVWLAGTAMLPSLEYCRRGHLGPINHVFAQTGLLLVVLDLTGRQRIWPSLFGLLISTWTRQMTLFYALPIAWIAWQRRRLWLVIAGLPLIVGPLMALNQAKFGNPFDFGYRYIYVNRSGEPMADRCHAHGVFSPHFIPENLYYLTIAPPAVDVQPTSLSIRANQMGTGMFVTTPLLLLVWVAVREWWRDAPARALMLGSLVVIAGLSLYHSPGFLQQGYNRFALDFVPVWLAVLAPCSRGGWRSWATLGGAAYSLLYFQLLAPVVG